MLNNAQENSPFFSIITPVYNGGAYFEDLIRSINSQPESSVEHVVIDDGSTDGITQEILNRYSHIRWWSRKNKGQYFSMNEGLKKAKGKWVCFICADDLLAEEALSDVKKAITSDPTCEMVWGKGCAIRADGSKYEVQSPCQRFIGLHRYLAHVPHSSIFVKRDYLLKINNEFNINLNFVADYFWILHLLDSNPKKKFINAPLSFHRMHPDQTTQSKRGKMVEEKERVRKDRNRSHFLYLIFHGIITLRSAVIRIIYKTKNEGVKAGFGLLMRFVQHNVMLEQ